MSKSSAGRGSEIVFPLENDNILHKMTQFIEKSKLFIGAKQLKTKWKIVMELKIINFLIISVVLFRFRPEAEIHCIQYL